MPLLNVNGERGMSINELWSGQGNEPLVNGPIRTPAAPTVPLNTIKGNGQVSEFLLSFPMHIIDNANWKSIEFLRDGRPLSIERPVPVSAPYQPQNRLGNEGAEAFCTIVRLRTPLGSEVGTQDGWKIIERLLEWVRVKCRHYWILHGTTGFGALYRGTVFTKNENRVTLRNFASYAPGVIVRPLTEAVWLSIREELEDNSELPLADGIFCDALLSLAARDEVKALLEAGVASEVAITQLLKEVSSTMPNTREKARFRNEKGDFNSFHKKLTEWPQRLGLENAHHFKRPGMHEDWVGTVQELYKLRNSVAHGGKLKSQTSSTGVASFIFAANTLIEFCRSQKTLAGLKVYSMPQGVSPMEQMMMYHDAILDTTTTPLECVLA
jgi:hypothetical protein